MAFTIIDTKALKDFQEKGAQCVKDFADIKRDFEEYNKAFLAEYEGIGAGYVLLLRSCTPVHCKQYKVCTLRGRERQC